MNLKIRRNCGFIAALACAMCLQYSAFTEASTTESTTNVTDRPVNSVKIPSTFTSPRITGFLTPHGFNQPEWQRLGNAMLPSETHERKKHFVVMLDPGHGGIDPGAKAPNGLLEKDLTLDIAQRVRLFLAEFEGIDVILTRDHDHGLPRKSRINAIHRNQADIVLSLHFNHLPQHNITLVESYYAGARTIVNSLLQKRTRATNKTQLRNASVQIPTDLSFTDGSTRLASIIQQRVFNEVSFENPAALDAGVKQNDFFVLTHSHTPSALIELTCLSNIDEADKLKSEAYRNRLAAALADGIRSYRESLETAPLSAVTAMGT